MLAFDTSAIVYGWDNYPPEQFPPLWDWLKEQIKFGNIAMSEIAIAEVETVSPDCHAWLKVHKISAIDVSESILMEASRIKTLLGIVEDKYQGGVGENDLLIIATSKCCGIDLVSNESEQPTLPKARPNYKMPAVCNLGSVAVQCSPFLRFLRKSGQVFK